MSQSKSPDGTFPTFPQTLWVDGELVNEDSLCVSASADRGTLGKLIDAAGYLKARGAQCFSLRTSGAGAVTLQRRTPTEDGVTQFLTAGFDGTTEVRLTFTNTFASVDDYLCFVSINGVVDWFPRHSKAVGSVDISFYDVSLASALDVTANIVDFDVVIFPGLAGMT